MDPNTSETRNGYTPAGGVTPRNPINLSPGECASSPGNIGAKEGKTYPMCIVRSVGKRRAGRLLDGREWNEVPEGKA